MSYTHYWKYNRDFTESEWKRIGKVFGNLRQSLSDIPLSGIDGEGKPDFSGGYLGFNGEASHSCEPFELYRTRSVWTQHRGIRGNRPWQGFSKTEHQPYDLAVTTLLLMIMEIAPDALKVESDEDMKGPAWEPARELAKRLKERE